MSQARKEIRDDEIEDLMAQYSSAPVDEEEEPKKLKTPSLSK
jgi:hypothetical protein